MCVSLVQGIHPPFKHHLPNKKQFFLLSQTLYPSKYTNPRKDESEWVFDYSKWTEDFVLCIYPCSMLGNDMHNKLIQVWGAGEMKEVAALCPKPFSQISCSEAAFCLVLSFSSETLPRLRWRQL